MNLGIKMAVIVLLSWVAKWAIDFWAKWRGPLMIAAAFLVSNIAARADMGSDVEITDADYPLIQLKLIAFIAGVMLSRCTFSQVKLYA